MQTFLLHNFISSNKNNYSTQFDSHMRKQFENLNLESTNFFRISLSEGWINVKLRNSTSDFGVFQCFLNKKAENLLILNSVKKFH